MTNEQLSVIFGLLGHRLQREIDDLHLALESGELDREMESQHTMESCKGFICINSSHYTQTQSGDFIALGGLRQLLDDLSNYGTQLKPEPKPE